jgi:hypothetical protein
MQAFDPVGPLEHVHGHLGWLAAAALVHPAVLLRNPRRKAHLAVASALGVVTAAGSLGAWLYPAYRDRLKQSLFLEAPRIGYLFERKEHLAFGAILLAWAGALAYFGAERCPPDLRAPLRTIAYRGMLAAAILAILTAALGTLVASFKALV